MNLINHYFFLFLFISSSICLDCTWIGPELTTSDQKDILSEVCDVLQGNVVISHNTTSLSGLINIKQIKGFLRVSGTQIQNFTGLKNLIALDGFLAVNNNPVLDNILLEKIEGSIDNIEISNNSLLKHVAISIESVDSELNLANNFELNNLVFPLLRSCLKFSISNSENLTILDGFSSLEMTDTLLIDNNQNLKTINDFKNLMNVVIHFELNQVPNLENIYGFQNLQEVGAFHINDTNVEYFYLESLTQITSFLFISNNARLKNLDFLHFVSFEFLNSGGVINNSALENILGLRQLAKSTGLETFPVMGNTNLKCSACDRYIMRFDDGGDQCLNGGIDNICALNQFNETEPKCEYFPCLKCAIPNCIAEIVPFCGDGITNSSNGESCDDGILNTDSCAYGVLSCLVCLNCSSVQGITSFCGDGILDLDNNEQCDGTQNCIECIITLPTTTDSKISTISTDTITFLNSSDSTLNSFTSASLTSNTETDQDTLVDTNSQFDINTNTVPNYCISNDCNITQIDKTEIIEILNFKSNTNSNIDISNNQKLIFIGDLYLNGTNITLKTMSLTGLQIQIEGCLDANGSYISIDTSEIEDDLNSQKQTKLDLISYSCLSSEFQGTYFTTNDRCSSTESIYTEDKFSILFKRGDLCTNDSNQINILYSTILLFLYYSLR